MPVGLTNLVISRITKGATIVEIVAENVQSSLGRKFLLELDDCDNLVALERKADADTSGLKIGSKVLVEYNPDNIAWNDPDYPNFPMATIVGTL